MHYIIQRYPTPKQIDLPDNLHPVIRQVLATRQVDTTQLDYPTANLPAYHALKDIDKAVALLHEALTQQWRILIVADYDADGATSCAVAMRALRQMGAKQVDFLVPNREKHGYGLSAEIVELALPYKPNLLITVDNGIVSFNGVKAAKKYGIKVLITDHHSPAKTIPNADAIVNPNQHHDQFPCKNLAGVGVIFYVMSALRAHLRNINWFEQQGLTSPNLANLLDLVALGTVADIVPLDYTNRILVEQGLRRIRANRCCAGIQALIEISKRNQSSLVTSDLGFSIAPRLNAAGRMDDMRYGIICLLSDDAAEALEYAENLNTFNEERRFVQSEMQEEASIIVDEMQLKTENLPVGLCLFNENWHQGVIGILASRVKERLHRPIIVFTRTSATEVRGSARSIRGVHIRDVIDSVAMQYPDMITKFGGHAMAAGLSLPYQHLAQFEQAFDKEVQKHVSREALQGIIFSDGELDTTNFNLTLAEELRHIPWGQGFHEPIFDGDFEIVEHRILKQKHIKMKVRPINSHDIFDAIAFNQVDENHPWTMPNPQVHLAYKLDVNEFRAVKNIQLKVEYIEMRCI